MSFNCQKGKFDRFFNRLDRPVEESRPDRQPDRPVDPTGAGRPDRFSSLPHTANAILDLLQQRFGDGVISRKTDYQWAAHSPDLNPFDFFLWGYANDDVKLAAQELFKS